MADAIGRTLIRLLVNGAICCSGSPPLRNLSARLDLKGAIGA